MTKTEFRNSSELRSQLRAILDSPVMTTAVNAIVDDEMCNDAGLRDDAIVSIRILSRRSGLEMAFRELHSLIEPNPEKEQEVPADWGTNLTPDQIAKATPLPPPLFDPANAS